MVDLIPRAVLLLIIAYLLLGIVVASVVTAASIHDPGCKGQTWLSSCIGQALIALLWPMVLLLYLYLVIAEDLFGDTHTDTRRGHPL